MPLLKPQSLIVVLLSAVLGLSACDRSNPQPPTAPTPAPGVPPVPAAPVLLRVSIGGNLSLSAVGETSALTATAGFSDGTTRNVTNEARWSSNDESRITVSSGGVLSVLRFGTSVVQAGYLSKSVSTIVRATPPGTFTVSGRVREPGSGGIENARVLEPTSGISTTSRIGSSPGDGYRGEYSLAGLTSSKLVIDKDGFEPVTIDATHNGFDDVPLQRIFRMGRGETVTSTIAPNDMDYRAVPNTPCYPCRMIRVVAAEAGSVQLRLTWTEVHSTLNVWVDGRLFAGVASGPSEVVAELPGVAGELQVYIGMTNTSQYYVPFTLTAAAVK